MKILCIGHAAYDITLPVESYPVENKKLRLNFLLSLFFAKSIDKD